MEINVFFKVFTFVFLIAFFRYFFIAGSAYLLFWKIFNEKLEHKRIQPYYPSREKILNEFKNSLVTFSIFAMIGILIFILKNSGYTKIYNDFSDYGSLYFLFSLIAMILLHDTYFYWTHKLMHSKLLFKKFHKVHHESNNPSPWAAFSFHPYEAVVEAGIFPLIIFLIPVHPLAIFIFLIFMTLMNVIGHLGYEMYPKGFTKNKFFKFNNTSTHHNMHHKYFNCNYGLYFNFWDSIMNTNHIEYTNNFEEVANRTSNTYIKNKGVIEI